MRWGSRIGIAAILFAAIIIPCYAGISIDTQSAQTSITTVVSILNGYTSKGVPVWGSAQVSKVETGTILVTFTKTGFPPLSRTIYAYSSGLYIMYPNLETKEFTYIVRLPDGNFEAYWGYGKSRTEPWEVYMRTLYQKNGYVYVWICDYKTQTVKVVEVPYTELKTTIQDAYAIKKMPDINAVRYYLMTGRCITCG